MIQGGEIEFHDITSVSNDFIQSIGTVDIICGGFPCQAFSIAGNRRGFEDTRGTLFFEIARFASILKPNILFLENVKGLLNHNNGETFQVILNTLDGLGYDVEWQLLNSKHFGVPQNRERVFIIGHLRNGSRRKIFPIDGQIKNINCVRQIGNLIQTSSYGGNPHRGRVYSLKGISPSLNCMGGGGREPKIYTKNSIRKLTPKECWRLQGFPDWAFEKAAQVNSDSQLYKQAGNSVTVNVIEAIAKEFI